MLQSLWSPRLADGELPRTTGQLRAAAAAASLFFIITEALIGAGLVLLELVADNSSSARGVWVAGHLINTFFLVAFLALTGWWAKATEPVHWLIYGAGAYGFWKMKW